MQLPKSQDVAHQLYLYRETLRGYRIEEGDVRLQVYEDGQWLLHTGDSQYDQDHRGAWGASCVNHMQTLKELCDVADELLDQVREHGILMGQGDA